MDVRCYYFYTAILLQLKSENITDHCWKNNIQKNLSLDETKADDTTRARESDQIIRNIIQKALNLGEIKPTNVIQNPSGETIDASETIFGELREKVDIEFQGYLNQISGKESAVTLFDSPVNNNDQETGIQDGQSQTDVSNNNSVVNISQMHPADNSVVNISTEFHNRVPMVNTDLNQSNDNSVVNISQMYPEENSVVNISTEFHNKVPIVNTNLNQPNDNSLVNISTMNNNQSKEISGISPNDNSVISVSFRLPGENTPAVSRNTIPVDGRIKPDSFMKIKDDSRNEQKSKLNDSKGQQKANTSGKSIRQFGPLEPEKNESAIKDARAKKIELLKKAEKDIIPEEKM
jgi:hypothetical protein